MFAQTLKPSPQYVYKTVGERKLVLEVSYPPDWQPGDRRPAIVFWSGGAFRTGGTDQFRPQAEYFAKRGMVAIRAEYRGREKDGAQIRDCLMDAISAMRWIRKNAALLGVAPDKIVASGGSAGGYLAVATWTTEGLHSPDDDLTVSPKPNAFVLFNPALGFTLRSDLALAALGPLAGVPEPLDEIKEGIPPALIMIGSRDDFLPACQDFVSKARSVGSRAEIEIYQDQPHAFFNRSPWMERTVLRADEFLKSLGLLSEEPKIPPPTTQ